MITVDCISDLHGHYPELPGGDLLIVAGDLTAMDIYDEYLQFCEWIKKQNYKCKILIAGNHDNQLQRNRPCIKEDDNFTLDVVYLQDELYTFEGITIYGTPWTPWFYGVNPHCKAFMANESKLKDKFDLIPKHIDILVSHGPPKGCLDEIPDWNTGKIEHVGSQALKDAVDRVQPLYHVFGHIHEHGGKQLRYKWTMDKRPDCQMFNVSVVDERYKPNNQVRRIILPNREDKTLDVKES